MKRSTLILPLAFLSLLGLAVAARRTIDRSHRMPDMKDSTGAITLPNGWRITPAGKHIKLPGDLPMKMRRRRFSNPGADSGLPRSQPERDRFHRGTYRHAQRGQSMGRDGLRCVERRSLFLSGGGHAKRSFAEALARLTPPAMKDSLEKANPARALRRRQIDAGIGAQHRWTGRKGSLYFRPHLGPDGASMR